eukprot:CAMPEP_0185026396 /NCGR_PEP_ID=MMETSP1103-20130426/10502_1 /TAXON_ID=36769 /ORGANISM="Paraphysomonas bandaiensis, Strain Caron Lab Isolate" /LENGTH=336 /DNA_ID=CAMNT_0027559961 /DNA_START=94 /DNA_END=1104 /DNA_ORIENTATION=+
MADNPHLLDSLLEDIESAVGSEGVQKSPLKYIPHPPHSDKHQSKTNPKNKFAVLPSSSTYGSPHSVSSQVKLPSPSTMNSYTRSNTNSRNSTPSAKPDHPNDDCVSDAALDSLLTMLDGNSPSNTQTPVINRTAGTVKSPNNNSPYLPSFKDKSNTQSPLFVDSSCKEDRERQPSQKSGQVQQQDTDSSFDSLMQDLDVSLPSPTSEADRAPFTPPIRATSTSSGNKIRCSRVVVAGSATARGPKTSAFSKLACDNLRCLQCNFEVMQFPERTWGSGVDYMFFRNNVPNVQKLSAELCIQSNSMAYCCQCRWLSAENEVVISTGNSSQPQWVCAGH